MPVMSVTAYAAMHDIPHQTVSQALKDGHIPRLPDGQLESDEVDRVWLPGYLSRKATIEAMEGTKTRQMQAHLVTFASEVQKSGRTLQQLRRRSRPHAVVASGKARRRERLAAGLDRFPAFVDAAMAAALERPRPAVAAALSRFAERVATDMAAILRE
jgi:beta-phosphoglucomutase-like phosphatase (HAD superfamily)